MPDQLRTAWMWANKDGISGMTIDIDQRRLQWVDEIGCACGDNPFDQTYEAFLSHGAPVGGVPNDVLAEIETSVRQLFHDPVKN
jgi:hypothetical protein